MNLRMFALVVSLLVITGCSSKRRTFSEQEISSFTYSSDTQSIPKKEVNLDRAVLKDILSGGPQVMNIRLVELFSGTDVPPRYRVMGFNKQGPYGYLGLQVGDVILAANNYIMRRSDMFPSYVQLLSDTQEGSIHLVRQGRELILELKIQ